MPADVILLLSAVVAAPLGLLWVEWHVRKDELRAKQASCYHDWSDPYHPVGMTSYWTHDCKRCGLQQSCDERGQHVGR